MAKKGYSIRKNILVKYEKDDAQFVIPDGVTAIGSKAFKNCTHLTSITIPNSVTKIESEAFYGCSNLISIEMPNTILNVEPYAFAHCTGLKNIQLSNSLISIGSYAFYQCSQLENVEFPKSLKKIGSYAFGSCYNFTSIEIPENVTDIQTSVFTACGNIKSITVKSGNPNYCAIDNCLIETKYGTIILGCSNSIIPKDSSITGIKSYAFAYCPNLTRLTIPANITYVGKFAFDRCEKLVVLAEQNSCAEEYAKENNIPFETV